MTKYHLIHKSGWKLIQEGNEEILQDYKGETKLQAIEMAFEYLDAQDEQTLLIIHSEDGKSAEEMTFPRATASEA